MGGGEIPSQEGTTQGDALEMPWYSINKTSTIRTLRMVVPNVKPAWLADDSAGCGTIANLYHWYKHLSPEGRKYWYLVNGKKSWLILKSHELAIEENTVFGNEINITAEGKRHLGAVLGSQPCKYQFCKEKVTKWKAEIETLSEITKNEPRTAYIALTKGYKSKFTYFMRTSESFEDYVEAIHEALNNVFLPTILGNDSPFLEELKGLFSLSPAQCGLGIP